MTRNYDQPYISTELQALHWGPIPLGWLLNTLSTTNLTPEKENALSDVLHTKGLVVLDAHQSASDILVSGVNAVRVTQPNSAIGPVAASHYYHPLYGPSLLQKLNDIPGVQVYPVFRNEDRQSAHANHSGLTPAEMHAKKEQYLKATQGNANKPGVLMLIAPFGSRKHYGEKMKPGVVELLRDQTVTSVCTATLFDWKMFRYVTHFSAPFSFEDPNVEEPMMRETLLHTYEALGIPHPQASRLR